MQITHITISSDPLFPDTLSPLIYGDFIEFINDLIPGMWAEKLQDRSFEEILQPNYVWPPGEAWVYPRWQPFVSGRPAGDPWPDTSQDLEMVDASAQFDLDTEHPFAGRQSARIRVTQGDGRPFVAGIAQDGLAVRRGQALTVEGYARREKGESGTVQVLLGRNYGVFFRAYDALEFPGVAEEWGRFAGTLTSEVDDDEASLAIGLTGAGTLWLDKLSLMPEDNRLGWRDDVVQAVKAMKPGVLRFGGSSLIYYQWEDGIGPREQRVPFQNQPWGNMEENDVGLHEFLQFCELVEAEPLICLNSNSTTLDQVMSEIEYCNGPADSAYGRLRAERGHPEPFHVKYWQIGNEQSGEEYERVLLQYARAIRDRYPDLALLASYPSDDILLSLSDVIDYVCPHFYAPYSPEGEDQIRQWIEKIDRVARNKKLKIGITEWNHTASHRGWGRAWLLTLYNALNAARMLNMYQRLGDRIRIANRSNLTNSCCSGAVQTNGTDLYLTPCYYVQKAYANLAGDTALQVTTEPSGSLDVAATRKAQTGEIALFVVNYHSQARRCRVEFAEMSPSTTTLDVWTLSGPSLDAVNSFQEKERIAPTEFRLPLREGALVYEFPACSVTVLRLREAEATAFHEEKPSLTEGR
jgi:alpha-N-arabinofuranosidase